MYQIRSRPKDQSSDEEDFVKDNDDQLPILSVNRKNGEPRSVSTAHSVGKNYGKISDFSMFKTNQRRCEKDGDKGIVMHCDALQRLGAALSVYATINNNGGDDEIESEDPIFAEFVRSEYRVQFMKDFNHFMEEHQGTEEEIKQEMMATYGLRECKATKCELTTRHFSRRGPDQQGTTTSDIVRSESYRKKFDSLHFHIFHLEESGYRYRNRQKSEVNDTVTDVVDSKMDDEEDDEKAVDQELEQEVATVNECKKKCDFGRFQGDAPNKFTLNVLVKTWIDQMVEYMRSVRIPLHVIGNTVDWLRKESYDTDAIKLDVNIDSIQSQQSSILLHLEKEPVIQSISEFVDRTKVSTFSIGLRFIYWEKCRGYKRDAFEENDDLYIDGPKYQNIKEELLNSGYCGIFAFNVLISKCKELMNCKKVKKMKASYEGTDSNKGYMIKWHSPITINHVQCVVSYCDLTDFCTALSATFRSEFVGESVESIKKRNQCYFHVSKGLREAVECFGNSGRRESGPFYCGMNRLLLLTQFGIRLNGPTSTSKSRPVAIRFAGEKGIVMKMDNDIEYLHFLDCVPFSQYPEEEERLFMGGRYPLIVKSILIMKTAQNFSHFFGVLSVFDCVVNGSSLRTLQLPPIRDYVKLQHLLDWSAGILDDDKITFPDFIYRTFECYRDNKTEILVDFFRLARADDAFKVYYEPLVHTVAQRPFNDKEDDFNALKWDNIFAIFPNTKMVALDCGTGRSVWGFSLPAFVRKVCGDILLKHPKLKSVVVKGVPESEMNAAMESMEKVVSRYKSQLLIENHGWNTKTVNLKRE